MPAGDGDCVASSTSMPPASCRRNQCTIERSFSPHADGMFRQDLHDQQNFRDVFKSVHPVNPVECSADALPSPTLLLRVANFPYPVATNYA